VESSCEFGIEASGSIKCWGTVGVLITWGLSSSAQLHVASSSIVFHDTMHWF
jgi:hypothetical protein